MNARILAAFLLCLTSTTGCIIVDHDDDDDGGPCCNTPAPTYPGDVTFLWTFANGRCADEPDVKSIKITIPGETLHNGGVYACNTAGVDGIVLHDFAPATYSYNIQAISYSNETLYEGSGTFTVNGDVRVNVDLTPDGMSYALVGWAFPPTTTSQNPSCGQAGVDYIKAQIDSGEWVTLNCADGMTNGGVETPWLQDGSHGIYLIAYGRDLGGRSDMPLYTSQGTFVTSAGSPRSETFRFFAVGGLSVRWELWDGNTRKTCSEAGVTGMLINLKDRTTGEFLYPDGDPQACTGAPILYQYLKPGQYEVHIRAMKGSTIAYSNEVLPDVLTVEAFRQKTTADNSHTVDLVRQY
ncbi:hypothetical protein ACN28E_43235 [Archangium lansingense]|uniref:hypothetical protein n=1 Tax=Archangium lansingense TaxID=2995310 RepID=UPI003B7A1F0C